MFNRYSRISELLEQELEAREVDWKDKHLFQLLLHAILFQVAYEEVNDLKKQTNDQHTNRTDDISLI